MPRRTWLLAIPLALGLAPVVLAAIARDDDEEEAKAERRVEATRAFEANCLMCHGADMTTRQRLTPQQWAAEVEKMVGWGSPLPPESKQLLIDHLAETYPNTQPAPPVERIEPARALADHAQPVPAALPDADLAKGATLFATHCASCHGPTAVGGEVGVNLVRKPILLREGDFHALLHDGRRRMPAFAPTLDEPARRNLLAWLRDRR